MAHFEHIRLQNHKGLNKVVLSNLLRINVLCGPNNSGKTTVLECVLSPNHSAHGKILDSAAVQRIEEGSMVGTHWSGTRYQLAWREALANVFSEGKVSFLDELDQIWRSVVKFYGVKSGTLTNYSAFNAAFTKELAVRPSVVLIPAKRRLETSKEVRAFDEIKPEGDGILNFLFSAKNKDDSSPARKSFDRICAAFKEISSGYDFDIFIQERDPSYSSPPTNIELRFRRDSGSWIQAVDCGVGLQELLIVLYFALASNHEVVLIEEPENHLHPEIQRRLISFLREKTDRQFFLSTHSSVFLNTQFADRVFTCRMEKEVRVDNATSRAALLTGLGYSIADNLVSDLVVLCEGPKDKPVLEEFFRKMGLFDLGNIKVWPLGGDIMDQLDFSVFQESHQLIALIDGDPGSSPVRRRFLKKCEDLGIAVTRLKSYAIENYFSVAAINSVMKGQVPAGITALDPNKRVSDQLGFEVKNNGGRIAKEMTLEDLKGTDLESFLNQVKSLAEQGNKKWG